MIATILDSQQYIALMALALAETGGIVLLAVAMQSLAKQNVRNIRIKFLNVIAQTFLQHLKQIALTAAAAAQSQPLAQQPAIL
jgi:hypothetical protein